jgi:heat shock protein HslJ
MRASSARSWGVRWFALAMVVAALGLAACSRGGVAPAPPLEGSRWVLMPESLGVPVPEGVTVTAIFADGAVSGSSGCNSYRGAVERSGSDLRIGPNLVTTDRACDAAVADVERTYLSRLTATRTYGVSPDGLMLAPEKGPALSFRAQPAGPPAGLWQVTGFRSPGTGDVAAPLPGTAVTLGLRADGEIEGRACNSYGGPWRADGTAITVGPLWQTEMYCSSPPGVSEQEVTYLEALRAATGWRVEDDRLTLTDRDGRPVVTATAVMLAVIGDNAGG